MITVESVYTARLEVPVSANPAEAVTVHSGLHDRSLIFTARSAESPEKAQAKIRAFLTTATRAAGMAGADGTDE